MQTKGQKSVLKEELLLILLSSCEIVNVNIIVCSKFYVYVSKQLLGIVNSQMLKDNLA